MLVYDYDSIEETDSEDFMGENIITKIKVVGVGGAGCNAINRMIGEGVANVQFIAANTDLQVLNNSRAHIKLQIGKRLTKGLGAGSKPEIGEKAAMEDVEEIKKSLVGADMVFITAGMGGGTGTGAAPVFAKIAKDIGALTVAVVSVPFDFEGTRKIELAQEGITKLKEQVDTMLIIANSKVKEVTERRMGFRDAFKKLDEVLIQAVQGISDIITMTGVINVDFADVCSVLRNSGEAIMGIGIADGDNRAIEATQKALANPLIKNTNVKNIKASALLANMIVGHDFTMNEYDEAGTILREYCRNDDRMMKIGVTLDETMKDKIKIVVLATGFEQVEAEEEIASIPAEDIFEGERKVVSILDMKQEKKPRGIQSGPMKGFHFNYAQQAEVQEDYDTPTFIRRQKKMG